MTPSHVPHASSCPTCRPTHPPTPATPPSPLPPTPPHPQGWRASIRVLTLIWPGLCAVKRECGKEGRVAGRGVGRGGVGWVGVAGVSASLAGHPSTEPSHNALLTTQDDGQSGRRRCNPGFTTRSRQGTCTSCYVAGQGGILAGQGGGAVQLLVQSYGQVKVHHHGVLPWLHPPRGTHTSCPQTPDDAHPLPPVFLAPTQPLCPSSPCAAYSHMSSGPSSSWRYLTFSGASRSKASCSVNRRG